ncbi:unnamed protein product [Brassica rapa]|uniref:Uncharacterized protein n=2 Tax=Brassica TaxID=3705 RepID=A0A8D9M1F8_BRACM|nr:unnamed protein product [Brassica napus]CAG7894713.1 unnamed protein product [Brassica rapa]
MTAELLRASNLFAVTNPRDGVLVRRRDIADDGVDMGVTSSGDQTGIGSRLSRRARNAYSVIKNNSIAFSRLVTIAL